MKSRSPGRSSRPGEARKAAQLTVTVTVPGLTGTERRAVQVLDKGKKITSFTMAPVHKGVKTVKLKKLKKGSTRSSRLPRQRSGVGSKSKKIVLYSWSTQDATRRHGGSRLPP